jgi:MarR family transcriptional regulator for hemolysin
MPHSSDDLRFRFGPLVAQVAREWRRAVDKRLQPFGLTEATWLPLLHIARSETPMRQNELAASLSLDGSSVVRVLDALEKAGLVDRLENSSDRRAKTLALTPEGRRTVAKVERVSLEIRSLLLGELSQEELAVAFRALASIRDRLFKISDALAA